MVYGILKFTVGIRLDTHEELIGSDLSVHQIQAKPEEAF
jgi:ammonia channel protein AmtB